MRVRTPDNPRRGRLAITTYPEGMTTAGNSCRLDYDTVVGAVPGDWYDAARVYGDWATRQPWATRPLTAAGPPGDEVQAWQVMSVPAKPMDEWATAMARVAERLGVRVGVHFYEWHQVPFDTSYPDYFPERPGFRELVARLKRAGILTMPYINARLWDLNSRSWTERQAARWAVQNSALRLDPRTTFPILEEYGSGQKLAPMCPVTPFWQDTVLNLCQRITGELGCDGVYLDQIGAAQAERCFARDHGHPVGGGGFWLEGYRQLMARVRAGCAPGALFTTECNWEGCIADFDSLLMWHSFGPQVVPLFTAVYGGGARTFGCQFNKENLTQEHGLVFATRMGDLLLWGAELGWGDLTLLLADDLQPLCDYFRRLCQVRATHRRTFAEGRMLRPPQLTPATPVLAAIWQGPGQAVTLFLVNPTHERVEVTLQLGAEEAAGLVPLATDGVQLAATARDPVEARAALPAFAAAAIPLRPA